VKSILEGKGEAPASPLEFYKTLVGNLREKRGWGKLDGENSRGLYPNTYRDTVSALTNGGEAMAKLVAWGEKKKTIGANKS